MNTTIKLNVRIGKLKMYNHFHYKKEDSNTISKLKLKRKVNLRITRKEQISVSEIKKKIQQNNQKERNISDKFHLHLKLKKYKQTLKIQLFHMLNVIV